MHALYTQRNQFHDERIICLVCKPVAYRCRHERPNTLEPLQFIDVVYAEEEGTDVSPEVTEGDVQDGLGKLLVRASGNSYAGGFKNGKFSGKGKMVYGNGMGYEGDWVDGLRHGYGKMTYANGEQYEGRWENNQPQSLFPVIKDSKKKKKRRGR